MREAKQVKSGNENAEKAVFLTLFFSSISCSVILGRGLLCLNAHFTPYLYSRIVLNSLSPMCPALRSSPSSYDIDYLCYWCF